MKIRIHLILVTVAALLLTAPSYRAGAAEANEVVLSEVRDLQGAQIHAISLKEAAAMAVWDPAVEEPPLSMAKGLQAAKKWLKENNLSEKASLGGIDLKTPNGRRMDNKWFYVFLFYVPPDKTSRYPRAIRVVVLMNGKVVTPRGE